MLITKDFDGPVLLDPAKAENGCNQLKIISGFTDCDRISTHMIQLADGIKSKRYPKNLQIELIVGMTKSASGLNEKKYNDIMRLMHYFTLNRDMPKFTCRYICSGKEVHSKIYVWSKDNVPVKAWCGSLNYTMNAFYKRRESVTDCNPQEALDYFNQLLLDTLEHDDPNVKIQLKQMKPVQSIEDDLTDDKDYTFYDNQTPIATINVSLLRADGSDTGYGSGINWGIRPNGTKRNQNQAYIPYNHKDRVPGFFPDRIHPDDENCPIFKVITKNFGSFHMRLAQQGNKALHSAESNALIGEWIRTTIHAPSGGYITKQMLENYGRTYVTFRKYEDGTYLLDF